MLTINRTSNRRLSHLATFPVSAFGIVMGISGLSRAFRLAEDLFRLNIFYGNVCGIVACCAFMLILFAFVLKLFLFPGMVEEDFNHPSNGSFFGTIPIALLLLSSVLEPVSSLACRIFWCTGTLTMLSLAYLSFYKLVSSGKQQIHITPVLILPIVGVLNIAVTSGNIPWSWVHEVSLLALAIGGMLTIVFFTLIFERLLFHGPLSIVMEPSLMILMSPFAVCFLAYVSLAHSIDLFASLLFYLALFLFMVFVFKIFTRQRTFIHTWWSVSFPIAALTNCSLKYAINNHENFSKYIAGALLALLTLLIIYMLIKTIIGIANGSLFRDQPSSTGIS